MTRILLWLCVAAAVAAAWAWVEISSIRAY